MTSVVEKISIGVMAAIFLVAVWARFVGISNHFSHIDDIGVAKSIILAKEEGRNAAVAVSEHWTYAPFQFLFTAPLLNSTQNYREILFWGRLPSAVFSVIGLMLFVVVNFRRQAGFTLDAAVGFALLSLSWAGIILAQQMHNYALGITASIIVLLLLVDRIRREKWGVFEAFLDGGILGVLTLMQYSVVFLMPAYFAVRFIKGVKSSVMLRIVLLNTLMAGVVYVVSVFPLWWFFLRKLIAAGYGGVTDWNRGPAGEFLFSLPADGWTEKVIYAFRFFAGNFYRVIESSIAVFPEGSFLRTPFAIVGTVLMIIGIIRLFRSAAPNRWLGWYIAGVLLTWIGLVVMGKLALAPTRHNMILLPLFCILISEGIAALSSLIKKYTFIFSLFFILFVLVVFLSQYPIFLKERHDPFHETEIISVVEKYQVDAVIQAEWTTQVEVMKALRDYYGYFGKHFLDYSIITRDPNEYNTILWISHREPLSTSTLQETYQKTNRFIYLLNTVRAQAGEEPLPFWDLSKGPYRTVFSKEVKSNVESEYSRQTRNGSNSFFLYVLKRGE